MPSIKWLNLPDAGLAFFAGLGRLYTGLCVIGVKIGLGVLVLSGEMLALQSYLQPWISVQLLRQTHALAGLILMLSLPWHLLRFVSWFWFWPRKKSWPDPVGGATSHRWGFSIQRTLDAAFWAITLLMVLTGLERFVRLEYDSAFLPLFPAVWWPLHSTLRLFWYALFLLYFVNYGKIWTKRALNYLRSP